MENRLTIMTINILQGEKMYILFTGNLRPVTDSFYRKMDQKLNYVTFCEGISTDKSLKNVKNYDPVDKGMNVKSLFGTFDFHTVIYFSQAIDGNVEIFDELQKLEEMIYQCRRNGVDHFIYVTTNDLSRSGEDQSRIYSRSILLESCERLCRSFADLDHKHVTIFQIPYLYSMKQGENQLTKWLTEAIVDHKVLMRPMPGCQTDFLCEDDLAALLSTLLDNEQSEAFVLNHISGGNQIQLHELSNLIKALNQDEPKDKKALSVTIQSRNELTAIPVYMEDQDTKKKYGWEPKHNLVEDMVKISQNIQDVNAKQKRKGHRFDKINKLWSKISFGTELIILFVLSMYLNHWLEGNTLLQFIDFRLLFVVVIGITYGLSAGILASLLASAGYIFQLGTHTQWQILFYNVQNWIPFATYFLLGSVCGYIRDKNKEQLGFLSQENKLFEEKYNFLKDMYMTAVENKNIYNSQIIGYQDSFGKLYSVVKKLDSTMEDKIFYEAVNVLEDVLGNHAVGIYTMNEDSGFARLDVCSKQMNGFLKKSIKLADYDKMMPELRSNKMFVNTQVLDNYPAYAMPIVKQNELVGMIMLMYADDKQMNMAFYNKFTIVSNLIKDSLLRAMDDATKKDRYIEGTQILKQEEFERLLTIKMQMREKNFIDYILLHIKHDQGSLRELSEHITGVVRNNDIIGEGKDHEIYLLLSQTKEENMAMIGSRLKSKKIAFDVVEN